MKKRCIILVAVLMLLTLCLCSCANSQLKNINNWLKENYSKITITETTTQSGDKLTSSFVVENSTENTLVTYAVEQWAKFDGTNIPAESKKILEGSVVVKDNKVVSQTGDSVDVDVAKLVELGFNFNSKCLKNVKANKTSLSADVKNPQLFLGNVNFKCKADSMKVLVNFSKVLEKITLEYTTLDGAKISTQIVFGK